MKKKFLFTLLAMVCTLCCIFSVTACQSADHYSVKYAVEGETAAVTGMDGIGPKGCKVTIEATYKGKPVTAIKKEAFASKSNIETVIIPDSVTVIGDSAFYYCRGLKGVIIGKGLKTIGFDAFGGCTSLTGIKLPEGVETIDHNAFNDCTGLISINIPASVTSLKISAFKDCSSLKTINFGGTKADWESLAGTVWADGAGNYTVYCTDGELTK